MALNEERREQRFVWMYFMKQQLNIFDTLPVGERQWYFDRFIEQKQKENAALEKSSKGR